MYSELETHDSERSIDDLEAMGIKVPEELREQIEETIVENGDEFFSRIEDGSELYWTFSPFGEEIVRDRKILPGARAPKQTTAGHSRGVHFIKPGISSEHALGDVDYTKYAAELELGADGSRIDSPFGIAVAFPVRYLVSATSYRQSLQESEGRGTKRDVVFLKSEDLESAHDYEYDLSEAYVYIIPRSVPGGPDIRTDPRFEDLFTRESLQKLLSEGRNPFHEAAIRLFKSYGYSDEWISVHLILIPREEVAQRTEIAKPDGEDPLSGTGSLPKRKRMAELELATQRIHELIGQDQSVVIPVETKKDTPTEHVDGGSPFGYSSPPQIEKLAVLPIDR